MVKKDIEIQPQDSNLDPLNSGQMLLPMSYWSSGLEQRIDAIHP